MDGLGDLWDTVESDALLTTIVGGLILAAIVGGILVLSKGVRRSVVAGWRRLRSLRVTTDAKVDARVAQGIADARRRARPARWIVGAVRQAQAPAMIKNVGGPAFSVAIGAGDGVVQITSAAAWDEISDDEQHAFTIRFDWELSMLIQPTVIVYWVDEAGIDQSEYVPIQVASVQKPPHRN